MHICECVCVCVWCSGGGGMSVYAQVCVSCMHACVYVHTNECVFV